MCMTHVAPRRDEDPDFYSGAHELSLHNSATPIQISTGVNYVCAIVTGGDVQCWGENTEGKLGTGSSDSKSYDPTPVSNLGDKAISISLGDDHRCAVLEDGRVQCWGSGCTPRAHSV